VSGGGSHARAAGAAGADPNPVRVQTRFERFPTSVKGAFVLQGADGNPHAVRFTQVSVARVPKGAAEPIPMEDRQFDVAPGRDLFVPFEAPVSDLDPGWYAVRSSIQVDGGRTWDQRGRPFTMPWSRSDVRRATIPLGVEVVVKDTTVRLERVDLLADAAVVSWRLPEPGAAAAEAGIEAALVADGAALDVVPGDARIRLPDLRAAEEGRTISYPALRTVQDLAVVVARGGARSDPVPLPLR
jgi:hypothetical protein